METLMAWLIICPREKICKANLLILKQSIFPLSYVSFKNVCIKYLAMWKYVLCIEVTTALMEGDYGLCNFYLLRYNKLSRL